MAGDFDPGGIGVADAVLEQGLHDAEEAETAGEVEGGLVSADVEDEGASEVFADAAHELLEGDIEAEGLEHGWELFFRHVAHELQRFSQSGVEAAEEAAHAGGIGAVGEFVPDHLPEGGAGDEAAGHVFVQQMGEVNALRIFLLDLMTQGLEKHGSRVFVQFHGE